MKWSQTWLSLYAYSCLASLQCVCPLLSWSWCSLHHLQHNSKPTPKAWKIPSIIAEIHSTADPSGPYLPPKNLHHIFTNSNQIPLHIQSQRLHQYFPGRSMCFNIVILISKSITIILVSDKDKFLWERHSLFKVINKLLNSFMDSVKHSKIKIAFCLLIT